MNEYKTKQDSKQPQLGYIGSTSSYHKQNKYNSNQNSPKAKLDLI